MPSNEHDMMVEYEQRLSVQAAQIAELMVVNAELNRINYDLSEILRKAAVIVAEEGLLERHREGSRWV